MVQNEGKPLYCGIVDNDVALIPTYAQALMLCLEMSYSHYTHLTLAYYYCYCLYKTRVYNSVEKNMFFF